MKWKIALWSTFALGVSACSVTGQHFATGGKCGSNADCNIGLVCSNNTCGAPVLGGSTDGGSDAGATDGGATDSGASSGSSSGASADSGSSSGSSSGLGADSGASSGSSSGASSGTGSTTTNVRFVNAAQPSLARDIPFALDLCVKDATDTTAYAGPALIGTPAGVAFKTATDFIAVDKASVNFRVVAAGNDCTNAHALFTTATPVDLSAGGTFTIVAYGQGQVTNLIIAPTAAPAAGQAHLNVVHAMNNENAVGVALPLPYVSLASDIDYGTVQSVDGVLPFASLLAITGAQDLTFAGIALAANAQTTLIALGDAPSAGSDGPAVLVCNDTVATAGCTLKVPTPTAYVRVANLDASSTAAVKVCIAPHAATSFASTDTPLFASVAQYAVTAFVPYALAGSNGFDVATVAVGSDCSAANTTSLALTTSASIGPNKYLTFVATPKAAQAANLTVVPTIPSDKGFMDVTVFNAAVIADAAYSNVHHNAENSFFASLPTLFNKPLGSGNVFFASSVKARVPVAFHASLQNQLVRFDSQDDPTNSDRIEGTASIPYTAAAPTAAATVFVAGDYSGNGSIIVCNDNGTSSGGLSVCVTTPASTTATAYPAYTRIANLSAAAPSAVLCRPLIAATFTQFGPTTAYETVSAFTAQASGTSVPVGVNGGVGTCATESGATTAVALVAAHYYTLYVTGDATTVVNAVDNSTTPPAPAATQLSATAFNGWATNTITNVNVNSVELTATVAAPNFVDFPAPFAVPAAVPSFSFTIAATQWSFAPPTASSATASELAVVGTGVYEGMVLSTSAAISTTPVVLWCNDQMVNVAGALTDCTLLIGTHN